MLLLLLLRLVFRVAHKLFEGVLLAKVVAFAFGIAVMVGMKTPVDEKMGEILPLGCVLAMSVVEVAVLLL